MVLEDSFLYAYASHMEGGTGYTSAGPFSESFLGNTAIHLDKAMQLLRDLDSQRRQMGYRAEAATNSMAQPAAEATSESSFSMSESAAPHIDTQALDEEIKAVIHYLIPLLKAHGAEMCTPQLLLWVRDVTLRRIRDLTTAAAAATRSRDTEEEAAEFDRFFTKQLASLLSENLTQFEGQRLQDCIEDMLVELSELLFNEMAFFKLINDLDTKDGLREQESDSNANTSKARIEVVPLSEDSDAKKSCKVSGARGDASGTTTEQEDEEDEETADEGNEEASASSLQLSPSATRLLAQSELKKMCLIGSDEDEDECDDEDDLERGGASVATAVDQMVVVDADMLTTVFTEAVEFEPDEPDDGVGDVGIISVAAADGVSRGDEV